MTLSQAFLRDVKKLPVRERRVVMLAMETLTHTYRESRPQPDITSSVTARRYAEVHDTRLSTAIRHLQLAGKSLFGRTTTYRAPGKKKPGPVRWLGRCTHEKNGRWIRLYWWHELQDSLRLLHGEYWLEQHRIHIRTSITEEG